MWVNMRPLHADQAIQAISNYPRLVLNYMNKVLSEMKR